jgi:hypothetical protein
VDGLRRIIGKELPLDQFHLVVRRAAMHVSGISTYGTCLVTCSDERQGMLRGSFERDVATPLISDVTNARDRVFSVSNLCGRLEPGAFALVDQHFDRLVARGPKLLVVEIASHVGRLREDTAYVYGQVDRFGQRSPCCGALTSLLQPTGVVDTVRHPWFEQLNAFFGPVRLAALRGMEGSTRMVAAAIVHAALQAESAVVEVLQDLPAAPTEVLLLSGVAVNQQWADGFLPVAYHHIRVDGGAARIVGGFSLRTTPEALNLDISGPRIVVEGGEAMENLPRVERRAAPVEPEADGELFPVESLEQVTAAVPQHKKTLAKGLEGVRRQIESIRHDPTAWRTYSRPILRSLFRALCVAEPELGLAAMVYEGGENLFSAHKLRQIIREGPSSTAGRRALHDIEAELQQLNHEDAQQVLDLLLANKP